MKKTILAFASISALAIATPSFAAPAAPSTPAPAASTQQSSAPVHLSLVARAQTKLKTLSLYNGPINGRKDAATIAAIRSFQTQNHLTVNGRLDRATVRAMGI